MRASPFNEHKLVLQAFMRTGDGRRLVEAAAEASRTDVAVIDALAAQLPPMDFYVPFRQQRTTWRGTPNVVVGATMDQDNPVFTAYTSAGEAVVFDARRGPPTVAVLILHPAERKELRSNPQPAGPGLVIQEGTDGQAKGQRIVYGPDGDSTVISTSDCGDTSRSCTGDGSGDGSTQTYMHAHIAYFGDGIGSAEIEYTYWDHSNAKLGTDRYTEVDKYIWYIRNTPVWPLTYVKSVTAVETDAFSNDDWGWIQWSAPYPGPNGSTAYPFAAYCELTGDPNTQCAPGTIVNPTDISFK